VGRGQYFVCVQQDYLNRDLYVLAVMLYSRKCTLIP
jgi:hypothetical protein